MYLRTPKRYRKPRRQVISMRWAWLWALTLLAVFGGWQLYQRRDAIAPAVEQAMNSALNAAQNSIATAGAPTPLPTENPSARVARANEAWDRGAIEEALGEYRAVLEAAPNNALLHQRVTLALIMQGQSEEALQAAEAAVTADPFNPDSWSMRALALDRAGKPERAISSALQALSLRRDDAQALAYMAEAYLDLQRSDLAQETIARALEADPNHYAANYVNGLIQWQVNFALDEASLAFEAASAEAPNLPYIAIDHAWYEWYMGNYDSAQALLNNVLELNPNNLDALYAMGYLYYQAYGQPDQARDYLQRCLTTAPANISCLAYMGTLQTNTGDTQGALQTYRALMATETQSSQHFLAAGRAYMNAGDCGSAVPTLRTGYALEQERPDSSSDRLALFEQYLSDCGAPAAAPPEATAEAAS
jgi:tetratricopeptide (TPR) repeat protein